MDAHYHRDGFATFFSLEGREFRFCGVHPWQAEAVDDPLAALAPLADDPHAGVGEIGLDRLKTKMISPRQRAVFERQLAYAAERRRPVVLHGAKCWGEVTAACRPYAGRIPAFLFHGFSRSGGLVPDIVSLNGYFSVGPALLNDHAVNYRQLVASLPEDRLLVETDADYTAAETVPKIGEIVAGLAQVRGKSVAACEAFLAANGRRFTETLR